jgi:AcrR family transcriptional regulator
MSTSEQPGRCEGSPAPEGRQESSPAPEGRRERKKRATRKLISDTATMLFLERGFANVSIREVADAADVSPTTVFAHFPQKEALVFDEDDEQRDKLIASVRDRGPGVSVHTALHDFYLAEIAANVVEHGDAVSRRFMEFLNATPALRDYAARMWLRHEDALAAVIAADAGVDEPSPEVRAYSRFVLQIQILASESDDPVGVCEAGFAVLTDGWRAVERSLGASV